MPKTTDSQIYNDQFVDFKQIAFICPHFINLYLAKLW